MQELHSTTDVVEVSQDITSALPTTTTKGPMPKEGRENLAPRDHNQCMMSRNCQIVIMSDLGHCTFTSLESPSFTP